MGPNAVRRPHGLAHGPSRCLVDLVVTFKRWEMGGGNTNGGRNRLNQRHYVLSRSCLCDTP